MANLEVLKPGECPLLMLSPGKRKKAERVCEREQVCVGGG